MPDPSVKMQFFGNAADAERAIVKLEQNYDKLEAKIKHTASASRRGSQTAGGAMKAMAGQIATAVAGYVSIQAAIGLVTAGYRRWREEIKQTAGESATFHRTLITELTFAGDLAKGPEVRKFLENVPGATREQASRTFFAVTGAAPGLPFKQRKAITEQAARLAFLDEEQLASLGGVSARIQRLAPTKSAEDVVDLAVAARAAAGDKASQLDSAGFRRSFELFGQAGFSAERSMALAVQGVREGLRPSSLALIAGKLGGEFDPKKVGREFTNAGAEQRLRMLMKDPRLARRVLGEEAGPNIGLFTAAEVSGLEEEFRKAQVGRGGGALARVIEGARAVDEQTVEDQLADAFIQKSLKPDEIAERALSTVRKNLSGQLLNNRQHVSRFLEDSISNPLDDFFLGFSGPRARLEGELGEFRNRANLGPEGDRRFAERQVYLLERAIDRLDELNNSTKRVADNSEPRINRNANTE